MMEQTNYRGVASENAHKMIFISDLPRNTAYLDVADYYEKHIGPCQICIKRPLFKHFYYAFVMFDTIENAKRAIEEHRYPQIKAGAMSRALSYNLHAIRGEPGGKDVQSTSIFIKGFEYGKWTHEDLYAKFCSFGKILSCKVSIDTSHNFLGFGYVQYSKIEEAQKAIKEMDKYDLKSDGFGGDGVLEVLEYQGKKSSLSKKTFNNVYVKNIPPHCEDDDLGELFKEFGEIQSAAIMRDADGNSKGFGFVCFSDPGAAEKAITSVLRADPLGDEGEGQQKEARHVNGIKLADLYVREAKKKSQRKHELMMTNFKYKKSIMFFSLFVKNFPLGTTEEELKIYFSSACQGEVTKVQIIPDTQQAFVNFEKQDQCKMAKDFARNVLFKSQFALYVEYCYPKEMRLIRNEELIDKRAQDKKKNQQNQAQIASLNGSQNLIDLLTMLLKPAFQFQNTGNQRRSNSLNNPLGGRAAQGGMPGGGQNNQMMQQQQQPRGYINNRSNYQGPQYRNNAHHQYADVGNHMHQNMRNNSMGMQPTPSGFPQAPTPQFQNQMRGMGGANQNQSMNQSQISASGSSLASSSAPQLVDVEYAKVYFTEIQQMFVSPEFKNADRKEKKEIVGNTIYKHVEKIVGDQKAPKITGMLIDLPEAELNFSVSQWNHFEQKVMSAFQLITQASPAPDSASAPGGATISPEAQKS